MTTAEAMTYLGVQPDGRLAPCSSSLNSVGSSYPNDKRHFVPPISYQGSADDARTRLKAILETIPRVELVQDEGTYLHYETESLIFRLVSDVEFLIDDERKVIDFRAAARYGFWDMGANARLVEKIKKFFASIADID